MNGDREGLDALRNAIEDVAAEIETGGRQPIMRRHRLAAALAASILLLAAAAGILHVLTSGTPEVEVLELKIHGRPVSARLVEGAAPGTILVVPRSHVPPAMATISVAGGIGGIE